MSAVPPSLAASNDVLEVSQQYLAFSCRSGTPPGLHPAAGGSWVPKAGPATLASGGGAVAGRPRRGRLLIL